MMHSLNRATAHNMSKRANIHNVYLQLYRHKRSNSTQKRTNEQRQINYVNNKATSHKQGKRTKANRSIFKQEQQPTKKANEQKQRNYLGKQATAHKTGKRTHTVHISRQSNSTQKKGKRTKSMTFFF